MTIGMGEENQRIAELTAVVLARDPIGQRPRRNRTQSWPAHTNARPMAMYPRASGVVGQNTAGKQKP